MKMNNNQSGQKPVQNHPNQFMSATVTLRKLQSLKLIPQQLKLHALQSATIHYRPRTSLIGNLFSGSNGNANNNGSTRQQKHLLMSRNNIIYYGTLSAQGIPQAYSIKHSGNGSKYGSKLGSHANIEQVGENGLMIFKDGSYYIGEFQQGKPNGYGMLTNLEKSYEYVGSFKNGIPHGTGIENIGQNVYDGEFSLGKKHGKGKLIYQQNNYYEGQFKDNSIHGFGKYYYNNNLWQGNWKDGYLQGEGKQIIAMQSLDDLKDASKYTGQFKKGQKDGLGRFQWGKGYQYDGQFKKGQLNGQGTFKFKGKVYAGVWSNGTEIKISQVKKYDSYLNNNNSSFNQSKNSIVFNQNSTFNQNSSHSSSGQSHAFKSNVFSSTGNAKSKIVSEQSVLASQRQNLA